MSTPQSTPIRHAKLGISSNKSLPLVNEYKKLLNDQHQRLSTKHQQDLELIDDIRSYVKARLSIEREYTSALGKLAKQHLNHINKKFSLLAQCDELKQGTSCLNNSFIDRNNEQLRKRLAAGNVSSGGQDGGGSEMVASSGADELDGSIGAPEKPFSLYRVWAEHIQRLQVTTKNRVDQFEQLVLIVDKLKDIRGHKATIGKKCLDTHLKRIHEDLMVSMVELEKAKKLYYEDECQAKKARENEEKIKKKRSGLLTKFTDLQAKKEKTSAQREATDIQSTQARNDYIMALAAANAHLQQYYQRDLNEFIHLIDDGVLDHCKVFMATLSESDINSLKEGLYHAQYWSKLINWTGSQQTNTIFLTSEPSACLRAKSDLKFEPCNNDPIQAISLEHNADYALQHEIDKWLTWFKKECRNLSQLMHQLDTCQHAFADGKRSIEFNGQTIEDLEPKIIDLKQQIRKCEAAKLKAQARLKVIKEGGMQIEEWNTIESEIRADMARAQEEQRAKRLREKAPQQQQLAKQQSQKSQQQQAISSGDQSVDDNKKIQQHEQIQLQISCDSDFDGSELGATGAESMHNLASVSRSTSNLMQKQQNAISGYSALTDPSLIWQDDYSSAWGGTAPTGKQTFNVDTDAFASGARSPSSTRVLPDQGLDEGDGGHLNDDNNVNKDTANRYDLLSASNKQQNAIANNNCNGGHAMASVSIQSSSPLSAIVNGQHNLASSPYQGMMSEAYKSDYECDYTRTGHMMRSTASSAEPTNNHHSNQYHSVLNNAGHFVEEDTSFSKQFNDGQQQATLTTFENISKLLKRRVMALYDFEKNNEDDLAFTENDVLFVIELIDDDPNWLKARNETTGEQGYIPASYVRLIENNEQLGQLTKPSDQRADDDEQIDADNTYDNDPWTNSRGTSKGFGDTNVANGIDQQFELGDQYCRALYDYNPDENTFEEDSLPHLKLSQGELIKIIDQGEDDGWWLVEKTDSSRARGHVPSMLVEEVEPGDGAEPLDDDEDGDDGSPSEADDGFDAVKNRGPPSMEPPTIEPPILRESNLEEVDEDRSSSQRNNGNIITISTELDSVEVVAADRNDPGTNNQKDFDHPSMGVKLPKNEDTQNKQEEDNVTSNKSSLIPTSFIIIEPTPEVESKRFEDGLQLSDAQDVDHDNHKGINTNEELEDEADGSEEGETSSRIVQTKPSNISYSVVNEDFVLGRPTRKPHQFHANSSSPNSDAAITAFQYHETLTTLEENIGEESTNQGDCGKWNPVSDGANYEPLSEVESTADMPVPPSVVVDSFDDDTQLRENKLSASFDEDQEEQQVEYLDEEDQDIETSGLELDETEKRYDLDDGDDENQFDDVSGGDVTPALRSKADEFSRQIINEALMLAPGASIGPSTSSGNGDDEIHHEDFDDEDFDQSNGDHEKADLHIY